MGVKCATNIVSGSIWFEERERKLFEEAFDDPAENDQLMDVITEILNTKPGIKLLKHEKTWVLATTSLKRPC